LRYEVTVPSVPSRQVAVVRDRRRWADLGAELLPLLDRVYAAVRAGKVVQTGENIFIYREGSIDDPDDRRTESQRALKKARSER
jgi:hypothetical protein